MLPTPPEDTDNAAARSRRRKQVFILGLLLVLLTFATFQRVPGHDFVDVDDALNVFENAYYRPPTWAGVGQLWLKPYNLLYMPVTYTVWAAAAVVATLQQPATRLSGSVTWLAPDIFHTLNLVFHIANVLLVFALLRRLVRSDIAAAAGAALFGIHPLQVESVAWVTGFNNVISGFFGLAALVVYLGPREPQTPSKGRLIAATALFVLALLSKPTAAALPLVALVIDTAILRRPVGKTIIRLIPWILLAGVLAAITARTSISTSGKVYLPLLWRPIVVLDALAFYTAKVLAPIRLSLDYGLPPILLMSMWQSYVVAAVTLAGLITLWCLRTRTWARVLLITIGLFAAGAAPMLGFVPFYFQHTSSVADRYTYLALLGPAFALAITLTFRPSRRAYAITALVLAALSTLAYLQADRWQSSQRLAKQIASVNPNSWHAAVLQGLYYSRRQQYEQALRYDALSVKLNSINGISWTAMGADLSALGRLKQAEECYKRAVELSPDEPELSYNYGTILLRRGKLEEGARQLEIANTAINAGQNADLHSNLGTAYLYLGRYPEAIKEFQLTLKLRPGDPFLLGQYGETLRRSGSPEAQEVLEQAVAGDSKLSLAHASLALVLQKRALSQPADPAARERSLSEMTTALKEGSDNAELQYRAGLFYRGYGDSERAATHLRAALRIDPNHAGAKQALQNASPKTL